ncbi:hypothetical protein AKJ16_DCAP02048 [Drosera capensis]
MTIPEESQGGGYDSPRKKMASLKAEKPAGTQKSAGAPKAQPSKPAPKKAEQKPREPKKKVTGTKPAAAKK